MMPKSFVSFPLLLSLTTAGLLTALSSPSSADLPDARKEGTLTLSDLAIDPLNVSAIAIRGTLLAIGSDAGASIQVFTKTGTDTYQAVPSSPILLDSKGADDDIEGLAWGTDYLYVTGSHSLARNEAKAGKTVAENHARLAEPPKDEPSRKQVFRLKLDASGALVAGSLEQITLDEAFKKHPILDRFRAIPSKENGIDIEGLAVDGDGLLFGLRGPSLRGPVIPVLAVTFADNRFDTDAVKTEDRFLDLGGRGIRAMTEAPGGGFLVLGGPVGSEPTPYQLYFWDGQDALIGKDRQGAGNRVKALCRIGCPPVDQNGKVLSDRLVSCGDSGVKPEGLEAVGIRDGEIRFIVVYDGADGGAPTRFSCPFGNS
ncbi:DUF3616 domain-containing protein [uncultured Thiodictyon sp.]|uniref:DUF3616 domain-containing protein n=1 Tax=uncultured Thiodictyon sp. TaxID=1846217 RepID=UPI0025D3FE46|nr:DUF3616 domain-containing protein [uncultured Thiodictyon sp.]